MGIGVENDSTFAGRLTNIYEIVNPSLIGYSSIDYLNVFNAFVVENRFEKKFDAVIIFWTLNDIYSNYPTQNPPSFQADDFLYSIIDFLRRNSKSYLFLKNLFSDRSKVYFDYDSRYYDVNDKLLLNSIQNLKVISSDCKKLNIPFYIFIFPYEYQLRQINNRTILNPQKVFTHLLNQNGIQAIDCVAAFTSGVWNVKDYFLYGDGIHFSEKGHQLLSTFIEKKLKAFIE
jgi:predicted heme/steroid binding protein